MKMMQITIVFLLIMLHYIIERLNKRWGLCVSIEESNWNLTKTKIADKEEHDIILYTPNKNFDLGQRYQCVFNRVLI